MMVVVLSSLPTAGPPRMPLLKNTPAEVELKGLVNYSRKKENWFTDPHKSSEKVRQNIDRTDPRPKDGFHAPHVRHLTVQTSAGEETYHVTYTITVGQMGSGEKMKETLFHHATIGVGVMDRLPDPTEAFTFLIFLGFSSQDNLIRTTEHPDFPAAVFIQPVSHTQELLLRSP